MGRRDSEMAADPFLQFNSVGGLVAHGAHQRAIIRTDARKFDEKVIPSRGALITTVEVALVPGKPHGRAVHSFRPGVLRDAMRIQLSQSIVSGNAVNVCPVCGNWFERGGRGGDVKRSIARFCSDRCRNAFHNKQRASK
jgi:hypothetical protein